MKYSTDTAPPPEADEDALRSRLVNRIAVAGVVIVALLGGLALIDTLYVAPPTPSSRPATQPSVVETSEPVEAIPETPTLAIAPEPPEPKAVPTISTQSEPEETVSPSTPLAKPSRLPATSSEGSIARQMPSAEKASSLLASPPLSSPRSLTQGAQAGRSFVLQMGVFNNVDNAQELLRKLQQTGVPAQIETRVQVGPFKTRKEADEARARLAEQGYDAGLLMAIRR